MTTKWTPGPWRIDPKYARDIQGNGLEIATPNQVGDADCAGLPVPFAEESEANARRIVACVNACEGLDDPSVVPELVEALREVVSDLGADDFGGEPRCVHNARRVLARIDGEQS